MTRPDLRHWARAILPICLLWSAFAFPPLRVALPFILPGIIVCATRILPNKSAIALVSTTVCSSISFWVVAIWPISWLGVSLRGSFWVVSVGSAVVATWLWAKRQARSEGFWDAGLQAGCLAAALGLFILPVWLTPAPPGADMSMHTYITRLVLEADGVPTTFEPYLPIKSFGAFSIGFHTLAALARIACSGTAALFRCVWAVDCLTYFLLFAILWASTSERFGQRASLIAAAAAVFLSVNPQHFVAWGGTPTVLSIALIAGAMPVLLEPRAFGWARVLMAGLVLSAAFLSHPIPALILAVIYCPYALYLLLSSADRPNLSRTFFRLVAMGLVCAACLSWFAARYQNRLSPDEAEWLKVWDTAMSQRWKGTIYDAPISLPAHLARYELGPFFLPLAFALVLAAFGGAHKVRADLYFVLAACAMIVQAKYQVLPFSFLMLPDRAAAMLPVFAAPLVSRLVVSSQSALTPLVGSSIGRLARSASPFVFACLCVAGYYFFFLAPALSEASVTRDDLRAFEWIRQNTRPDAHIANNYSDAGVWIPAMTRRSVSVPHVNILHWEETKLALAARPADYIYLGAKRVYQFPFEWDEATIRSLQPRPKLVFASGNARLFKLNRHLAQTISRDFLRLVAGKGKVAGQIEPVAPANGETIDRVPIVLRWERSGCRIFNVQLSLCPNFDNPLPIYNSYPAKPLTECFCDVSSLFGLIPEGLPVYWRVRGIPRTGGEEVLQSPVRYFVKLSARTQ